MSNGADAKPQMQNPKGKPCCKCKTLIAKPQMQRGDANPAANAGPQMQKQNPKCNVSNGGDAKPRVQNPKCKPCCKCKTPNATGRHKPCCNHRAPNAKAKPQMQCEQWGRCKTPTVKAKPQMQTLLPMQNLKCKTPNVSNGAMRGHCKCKSCCK